MLAGALLLAATSLYASDRVSPDNSVSKAGPVDGRLRVPGQPPVGQLAGDDDMPNRSATGRGTIVPGTIQTNPQITASQDSGWDRLVMGLRQRWILLSKVFE
jgi:hypothetical protein